MLLRYLKRDRRYLWPPTSGAYGLRDTLKLRRDGVLTSVHRIGSRLSVTIRFEGRDYVTLLDEWKPPPTVDDVEAALRRGVGRSVEAVGDVGIGEGHATSTPDLHRF